MTPSGDSSLPATSSGDDPLLSLATVRNRMDLLRRFLSDSINRNARLGRDQMDLVSSEIASAIHQIIVNGAALLATAQQHQTPDLPPPTEASLRQPPGSGSIRPDPVEAARNEWVDGGGDDVVEIDAVELLAEHIHRCEICGKGFKRDANLRMHMRAHGNQFKTPEALAKPQPQIGGGGGGEEEGRKHAAASTSSRFSCPFQGCNRNRMHRKFRPLKSVICVRNHFKRSHCPKMYACNRCNKKHFSVLADLKSHLRHCGESKWKCSCGTSFSRKDKLFGHMALFEGHMPAVAVADDKSTATAAAASSAEEEGDGDRIVGSAVAEANSSNSSDNGFFEGLLEEFAAVDGYCLQDIMLESPTTTGFSVAAGIVAELKAQIEMAGIVVLGNRGSERTYGLLRLSFNSFLRSFSTDVPPNPNTSPSTNKIKKWMKNKKTLFEVAQFLPNWGIGYHVAKTRWSSGLSYEITKIDVYEDGIHGKAWGIPHKTKRGLHSTDAPRKMSEANKRIWKYLPNLGNAKKKSADPNVEEKSTDPKVEAA